MNAKTKLEKLISLSYDNIGGIIVQKKDKICYENYWNGCDASSSFHIFSVTKSILSILIGIAFDQGYLKSVDQKVLDFFPEYKVKQGEKTLPKVTIQDMLTMTVPYKYKTEPYEQYFTSEDWVNEALNYMGGHGEIGEFRYAPIIGPDVLSGILTKVTGKSVREFANEVLFSYLGIKVSDNITFKNKEEQLEWYKQKEVKGWVADPKGINTAGWGLGLTTRDLAKIGQLYLNGGKWNGKQIVSTDWIETSTTKYSEWNQLPYGYLWWLLDEKERTFAALGDGGNVIYVNPKKEMVIAISSTYVPNAKDRIKLIQKYIEPVFIDE